MQYGAVKKCSQVEEVCTLLDLSGSRVKCQLESQPMNCYSDVPYKTIKMYRTSNEKRKILLKFQLNISNAKIFELENLRHKEY